jgi:hypothetical protein
VKIDKGIPIPERKFAVEGKHHELRQALLGMNCGDSFAWPENRKPYKAADQVGVVIKTRKVNGSGYRVWRVK